MYVRAIKGFTLRVIFETSVKIARAFLRVFKCYKKCKSFIPRAFIRLFIYYMTVKIAKIRA